MKMLTMSTVFFLHCALERVYLGVDPKIHPSHKNNPR